MNYNLKKNKNLLVLTDGSIIFIKKGFYNFLIEMLEIDYKNSTNYNQYNKNLLFYNFKNKFKYKNKFLKTKF